MENYKTLIREAFENVVEKLEYDEAKVKKYFSSDYQQFVDGEKLDFEGFCRHMKVQKQALKNISIEFNTIVQEEDIVFTNHLVTFQTKEGRQASIHVIAEFRWRNQQIIYCNELTRMTSGHEDDRDLGSRH